MRGLCLGVLVLRLEVGHHLRCALGAQPFVVVDAGPSVVLGGDGTALCRRWGNDGRLRRQLGGVLHTSEPIFGSLVDGPGAGSAFVHRPVGSACGEAAESVDLPRSPVEQSVGPEECRTFFEEPLAHLFGQGIELSHRSTSGLGRNGDRGSGRSEDPHREATRGVGPVTGSAGSESLPGRGGRHPASSLEGLLVLIPSRGPHPCFRCGIGPAGSRAGTESQPACRRGRGSRVADGSPWGSRETREAAGSPAADRDPGRSRFAGGGMGPGSSRASAGGDLDPDHSRLAGGGKGPGQQRKLHTAGQLAAPAR